MSIRIRTSETKKSKPKNGAGKLFVYRSIYNKASDRGGVAIPAHTVVAYVGSLARFTEPGQAVVDYRAGAVKLDKAELEVLDTFLTKDLPNALAAWPVQMVAACLAQAKKDIAAADTRTPIEQAIELLPLASAFLTERAEEIKSDGGNPRMLRTQGYLALKQAWDATYTAAQNAGIATKRGLSKGEPQSEVGAK